MFKPLLPKKTRFSPAPVAQKVWNFQMCNLSYVIDAKTNLTKWSRVFVASLLVTLVFTFAPSHATQLPFQYRSTDMSEIEVNLGVVRLDETGKKLLIGHLDPKTREFVESRPTRTIRIPRAYIHSALPYTKKYEWGNPAAGHGQLPDKLFANSLTLYLSYPNGIPHTIFSANWDRQKPDMTQPLIGNTDLAKSDADQRRLLQIKARIRPMPNGLAHRTGFRHSGHYPGSQFDKGVEGHFRRYESSGRVNLYDDQAKHDVVQVSCPLIEKSQPLYFCDYTIALNSHIRVKLTFVDYRFHGGLPFVRERVRVFKKAMCPIFDCDVADPALRGAAFIGDKRRVCTHFDPVKRPKREVTFGFTMDTRKNDPSITEGDWEAIFQKRHNELLTLSIPEDYNITVEMARDRPEIATQVSLPLFETDMSPSYPVKWQFWDPSHDIGDIPATCLKWGEVSMGELERISSYLTLRIVGLGPAEEYASTRDENGCFRTLRGRSVVRRRYLDHDGMIACRYRGLGANNLTYHGRFEGVDVNFSSFAPKKPGTLSFRYKNLSVSFRTQSLSNWREKYKMVVSWLGQATVQKNSR
jgi:hypothetical protein